MELEEKLKAEAIVLANRLDSMSDKKSEDYKTTLLRYQAVMEMLSKETARINANQSLELQARKMEIDQEKIEVEAQQKRLEAQLEEERLKQQKRSNWWQIGLKILGGVVTVGVNLATIYTMIRFNNSGETLTSFENKFIFPDKFR